ncbi:MAG: molybdenum cofactor guanylyltransferase MobA [Bradyrhizobiaceae bacterium]|nr:MAG: molybdenum cofactor guanylyltransferase MobA [Bradyrhizobiaceae bacterium]
MGKATDQSLKPPGVLLAGGLARRIGGGDKPLREIGGRSILSRVIARMAPQCDGLVLNANGDPARFTPFGLPVAADSIGGFAGPLAGILAGMDHVAARRPDAHWIMTVPADTPFLPRDLVARLDAGRRAQNAQIAVAASGGHVHHVVALWSMDLREDLRRALSEEKISRVSEWIARYPLATVEWPATPFDPFFNINAPDDLAAAERMAALDDNGTDQERPQNLR